MGGEMKPCPRCQSKLDDYAVRCRSCGHVLTKTELLASIPRTNDSSLAASARAVRAVANPKEPGSLPDVESELDAEKRRVETTEGTKKLKPVVKVVLVLTFAFAALNFVFVDYTLTYGYFGLGTITPVVQLLMDMGIRYRTAAYELAPYV